MEKKMTRAIKIEGLNEMDKTSIQILRVISLHLGADEAAYVDYKLIATSLGIDRDVVRKAINRMIKHKVLEMKNGKLSILNSIVLQ